MDIAWMTEADGTAHTRAFLSQRSEHVFHFSSGSESEAAARFQALSSAPEIQPTHRFLFSGGKPTSTRRSGATDSVLWLRGDGETAHNASCDLQLMALSGTAVEPIRIGDRTVGVVYQDAAARYCRLWSLLPEDLSRSRPDQCRSVFETMRERLRDAGFAMTDAVRTWFYLDRILDWYTDFNRVRTTFFEETGIMAVRIPASTGIGAGNSAGAALVGDVLAIQPTDGAASVFTVPSPLQDAATTYRSSFSRAVELEFSDSVHLLISGTASIGRDGKTMFPDSSEKQIEQTLRVVGALLESRGMDWSDTFRSIAYFRDRADIERYAPICQRMGIPRLPGIVVCAHVCRPDLAFELELDALRAR